MNPDTITLLKQLCESREEFKATPITGDDTLNYHAFELFGSIIVLENYIGRHDNSREFLVLEGGFLRDCTSAEDAVVRAYDDEFYLLEDDNEVAVTFITQKDPCKHEGVLNGEVCEKCEEEVGADD